MHTTILATFLGISNIVVSMCGAGILVFFIALWAAKAEIAHTTGLDKIVALSNFCFAIPLAVFGALHVAAVNFVAPFVPKYIPWRLFWAYFVGFALLAASLSIATKIEVRWSGLLFGIMMFMFATMMDFRAAFASPRDRLMWMLALREMAFGGGGWILAGHAIRQQSREKGRGHGQKLIAVGRVLVGYRRHILWD